MKGEVSLADANRRMRVLITGCGVSLTLMIPFALAQVGLMPMMPPWLAVIALLMLLLFPLTVAYVIVVQRAMDVRMVVRSGLQYALASHCIKILRVLLIVAVALLTVHFVQQSEHRIEGIAIFATGAVVVILLSRLARWVGGWIDRRFFREAYNADRILTDLSSSVAGIRDPKRLVETVATASPIPCTCHVSHSYSIKAACFNRLTRWVSMAFHPQCNSPTGHLPSAHLRGSMALQKSILTIRNVGTWYPQIEQATLQTLETRSCSPVYTRCWASSFSV